MCVCVCVCVHVCVCVRVHVYVCVRAVCLTSTCLQPKTVALCNADAPINVADTFQYLGSTVSDDYTTDSEITHHITKMSPAFQSLNHVVPEEDKTQIKLR